MKTKGITLIEVLMVTSVIVILFTMGSIAKYTGVGSALSTVARAELTAKGLNTIALIKKHIASANINVKEFHIVHCDGTGGCPAGTDKLQYKVPVGDLNPIAGTIYAPDGSIKYGAKGKQNCYYEIFMDINNQLLKKTVCGYMPCNFNGTCEPEETEDESNCPSDCHQCGAVPKVCASPYEDLESCCQDCPGDPECGDGKCCPESGENAIGCLLDCPGASLFKDRLFRFIFITTAYADEETTDIEVLLRGNISGLKFAQLDSDGQPDSTGSILRTIITLKKDNTVITRTFQYCLKNKSETTTVGQCDYDSICELGEGNDICSDCYCGDNLCLPGEQCGVCEECSPCCGDGDCNGDETCGSCPEDCPCGPICGENGCESGETCRTCWQDCGLCPPVCPDTYCDPTEHCGNCPADCECECGDGYCSPIIEDETRCPEDCGGGPIPT